MVTFIMAATALFVCAWLSYVWNRMDYYHSVNKAMLQEISKEVIEESMEVKKKINMLFDLLEEIRQDIKKDLATRHEVVKEKPVPKKEKAESGTYIRSEETRRKLSEKRKAYWDAKKAGKLNESTPGNETI